MSNVIHRSFLGKISTDYSKKTRLVSNPDNFHAYGLAGGHIIGIERDVQGIEEGYIRIVLKALDGSDHVVASFSDTPEGQFHADVTAMAILRSFSII